MSDRHDDAQPFEMEHTRKSRVTAGSLELPRGSLEPRLLQQDLHCHCVPMEHMPKQGHSGFSVLSSSPLMIFMTRGVLRLIVDRLVVPRAPPRESGALRTRELREMVLLIDNLVLYGTHGTAPHILY